MSEGTRYENHQLHSEVMAAKRSKKATAPLHPFIPLSVDEAKTLRHGQTLYALLNDGTMGAVRVSGKPITWKTRPGDVEVPTKYGLYDNAHHKMVAGRWVDGGLYHLAD